MQKKAWEREYNRNTLVSGSDEPQTSVKNFLRTLRREYGVPEDHLHVLDLGCGNGKNSIYIAEFDSTNTITGIDISSTALALAKKKSSEKNVTEQITYIEQSIGEKLPFLDESFDVVLDVTSSNSLNEKERALYLTEMHRVLKKNGYVFVRALCKDGDTNAQALLKIHPGPEKDTYTMPEVGITERVFSREDFIQTYSSKANPLFTILSLEKETHYTKIGDRSYKRNFWIAHLQKK